ncbi:D-2-hydroxyacid dehydrogenase [Gorillibacterium sp. sgz5001074]|uniref:D-2-hydroxyacid dehydrogenase n=1 Tax=Gorillibacterium sp. sgz5001074 TaxID=3446695 RepID=UPI003F6730F2
MRPIQVAAYTRANIAAITDRLPGDLAGRVEIVLCRTPEELAEAGTEAEIFLATGKLEAQAILSAPKLRWIQMLSAGVDGIPLAILADRGIRLTNVRGIHRIQMSEFALLYMLQWCRRPDLHLMNQRNKVWGKNVPVNELYGRTVGILGPGSIGRAVAEKARAFGMTTLGYSRSGQPQEGLDAVYSGREGLLELLSRSDFVVLLLPATEETRHFIAMEELRAMKPTAFLINLARGSVVKEDDLIEALRSGVIGGAALDVFEKEPLPEDSPLWELPNVFITPHVAGLSPHYMARAAEIVFENLRRYLDGRGLMNDVNLETGY